MNAIQLLSFIGICITIVLLTIVIIKIFKKDKLQYPQNLQELLNYNAEVSGEIVNGPSFEKLLSKAPGPQQKEFSNNKTWFEIIITKGLKDVLSSNKIMTYLIRPTLIEFVGIVLVEKHNIMVYQNKKHEELYQNSLDKTLEFQVCLFENHVKNDKQIKIILSIKYNPETKTGIFKMFNVTYIQSKKHTRGILYCDDGKLKTWISAEEIPQYS